MTKDLLSASLRMKELKMSQDALMRSYYFEVCTNLDVLAVIDAERLKKLPVNSPAVSSMLSRLETQMAAAIIFSDEDTAKKLYDFISISGRVQEISEDGNTSKKLGKSVLEAISFTLQKIIVLQKISAFQSEKDEVILKNLRLKIRIENIREHLIFIKKRIESLDKTGCFLPETKTAPKVAPKAAKRRS